MMLNKLYTGNFLNPPGVPAAFEVGGQKHAHHGLGENFGYETGGQCDDIGIVVLSRKGGNFLRPANGAANLLVFVGRNGHPVGAAAKQYAFFRLMCTRHLKRNNKRKETYMCFVDKDF